MTATDELRRMLDERGVEWCPSAWDRSTETYWKTADGNGCLAIQGETKLRLSFADYLTPEQAIEATLGPRVQPPAMPEQPPYDLLIDLLRDEWDIDVMWDGLRRFWYVGLTDEGVRKRDEREATLGRGMCSNLAGQDEDGEWGFRCSECGAMPKYGSGEVHVPSSGELPDGTRWLGDSWVPWRYCPNCGRKVVDDASVD